MAHPCITKYLAKRPRSPFRTYGLYTVFQWKCGAKSNFASSPQTQIRIQAIEGRAQILTKDSQLFCVFSLFTRLHCLSVQPWRLWRPLSMCPTPPAQSSTAFTVKTYQIHPLTLSDFAKQSRHLYQKTQRRFSPPGQFLHAALMPSSLPNFPKLIQARNCTVK